MIHWDDKAGRFAFNSCQPCWELRSPEAHDVESAIFFAASSAIGCVLLKPATNLEHPAAFAFRRSGILGLAGFIMDILKGVIDGTAVRDKGMDHVFGDGCCATLTVCRGTWIAAEFGTQPVVRIGMEAAHWNGFVYWLRSTFADYRTAMIRDADDKEFRQAMRVLGGAS